ncbi:MAG: sensor histidine kinase [Sphingobium sp.]
MRFNDLMQTVLAAEQRTGLGAVTLWRQCVDMLAQHDRPDREPMDGGQRDALLDRLAALRPQIAETQRIATVVDLGGQLRSMALIAFFANDRPAVAAAAMARARLPDSSWAMMVPRLTPTARGVLRGRNDMGADTRKALDLFGPSDLVLTDNSPAAVRSGAMLLTQDMIADADGDRSYQMVDQGADAPSAPPGGRAADVLPLPVVGAGQDQIRNLVDRIEQFTSGRRIDLSDSAAGRTAAVHRAFAFETDAAGTIIWVDQGARAALIGLSLGETALDGGSGPDGHVAGAFARRSGFQNGRYMIVGGMMAGEWRMSATPYFDSRSGRFQGYRGHARRPHLHEVAAAPADEPIAIAGLSADSLRQLVHELRTPLNAILGFAEIIEQQLFGPTGREYRDMASKIGADAQHLLAAFDDLDLAARVSHGYAPDAPRLVDPALLVADVTSRFREHGSMGGGAIDIAIAPDLPLLLIDPVRGERMVQHLLRTVISVAPAGEGVTGACWFQPDSGDGRIVVAVDRPSSLAGMEETQLLDPGYTPDGEWPDGPLLGLGFSLRLIRSLAAGSGGRLDVEAERFLLAMPAASADEEVAEQR